MASSRTLATLACLVAVGGCGAPAGTETVAPPGAERHPGPDPQVRLGADGFELDAAELERLAAAARRLGADLAVYLYARERDDHRIRSASVGLRAALDRHPPFVSDETRGTPAAVRRLELTPQGPRAAIVRVLVEDRRSVQAIGVQFERRGSRWRAAYLLND